MPGQDPMDLPVSQQNPTISNLTAAKAGTYSVTATVNGCTSPAGTTSVTINQNVTPSVSITSTSTAICTTSPSGSTPVTFTATPINGGTNPTYQWRRNGSNITGATGATYTASSLADGSQISVVMTSNATCASPVTATSNVITMTGFTTPAKPVFVTSSGNVNVSDGICPPVTGLVYTVKVVILMFLLMNGKFLMVGLLKMEKHKLYYSRCYRGCCVRGNLTLKASAINACGKATKLLLL